MVLYVSYMLMFMVYNKTQTWLSAENRLIAETEDKSVLKGKRSGHKSVIWKWLDYIRSNSKSFVSQQ